MHVQQCMSGVEIVHTVYNKRFGHQHKGVLGLGLYKRASCPHSKPQSVYNPHLGAHLLRCLIVFVAHLNTAKLLVCKCIHLCIPTKKSIQDCVCTLNLRGFEVVAIIIII